jgi:hypothetical protein
LAVFLPSAFGFVGERRLKKQLGAASKKDDDVEASGVDSGRLSTQHQRNLKLSKQNLESASTTLNPVRESEASETVFSMASTVVMSAHVQAIRGADEDHDGVVTDNEGIFDDKDATRNSLVSIGGTSVMSTNTGRIGRVEMTDEDREKAFISTDMTLYNTHRKIFWLGLWVSFWAIVLAVVVLVIEKWIIRFAALTAIALVVAFSVYFVTKKDHQLLACVALFIFLRQVFTPDIEMSIFYWYTEADDGPHFSAIYIG